MCATSSCQTESQPRFNRNSRSSPYWLRQVRKSRWCRRRKRPLPDQRLSKRKRKRAKVPRQQRVRPQLQPKKRNRRSNLLAQAQRWRIHAFGLSLGSGIRARIMPVPVTTSVLTYSISSRRAPGLYLSGKQNGTPRSLELATQFDETTYVHESKRQRAGRCGSFLQDRLS